MKERSPNAIGGSSVSMILFGIGAWAAFVYFLVNVFIPLNFFPEEPMDHIHVQIF